MDLANRLRREGIETSIDQWQDSPPETWQLWCYNQVQKAAFVLVVCTETYKRRVMREDDPRAGQGATWEGAIISGQIYATTPGQTKFVPTVFSETDRQFVPFFLDGYTVYDVSDPDKFESLALRLKGQHRYTPEPVASQDGVEAANPPGVQPTYQPGVQPTYQPREQAAYQTTIQTPPRTLRDIIEWAWVIEIQSPGTGLAVMRINLYGPRTGSPAGQRFEAQAVVGPPGWMAAGTWMTPTNDTLQLFGEQRQWVYQPFGGPVPQQGPYQVSVSFSSVAPDQLAGTDSYGQPVSWRRL